MGDTSIRMKGYLKTNMFFIGVLILGIVYITRGLITIEPTGKTVLAILADSALAMITGYLITSLLSKQGLMKGIEDLKVQSTNNLHAKTVVECDSFIDKLDEFCELENDKSKIKEQTRILAPVGLSYKDFINENFKFIEDPKDKYQKLANAERRKAIRKAKHIKLTSLTACMLTSDGGKQNDPFNLGKTTREYESTTNKRRLYKKVLNGVVFGYFGVGMVQDFNWTSLLWTGIQVIIFITMGMLSYAQSYTFMTDENRQRTIKKINILHMFINWSKADTSKEEVEVKQEIVENKEVVDNG